MTLAVIALGATLVLPRLGDARGLALAAAARRLADTVAYGRDRAILGGRPMRLVLDLEPDGDALPARIDLADGSGRRAGVVVPPAGGRPRVEAE